MKKIIFWISIVAFVWSCSSCKHSSRGSEQMSKRPIIALSDHENLASGIFLTDDEKGNPVMSWVETDTLGKKLFFFATLDSSRRRFSKPSPIPIEQNAMSHSQMNPKIAVKGDGTIIAIYETSTPYKNLKWGLGDIHYIQSFDHGYSWTTPRSVSADVKEGLSTNYTDLARLGNGEVGISWLGTHPKDTGTGRPVYFAKTRNQKGFGKEILVSNAACECCQTALCSDPGGGVSVGFRDILPEEIRDISLSTSSNNGASFSRAFPFSRDGWKVNGCPHSGPSIATSDEKTYAVWFSGAKNEAGIYYGELDTHQKLILKKRLNINGRWAQICLMPDTSRIVVYNMDVPAGDSVRSAIMVTKVNEKGFFCKNIIPKYPEVSSPVVQQAGKNEVVAAWLDRGAVYYQLININDIIQPMKGGISPLQDGPKDFSKRLP